MRKYLYKFGTKFYALYVLVGEIVDVFLYE